MTTPALVRRQLRTAFLPVLQALVGVTVESPPVTATAPKQLPYVGLRCGTERKAAEGKRLAKFTTTSTLEVIGRVSASTPEAAQDSLEALALQIELAVLGAPTLIALIQSISNVTTTTDINGDGSSYQAGIEVSFDCETYEVFDPTQITPANYPGLEGLNVHVDAGRPFDTNGIYLDPPFPDSVTPAPRTAGPDGRDEGYLQIDLPQ